MNHKVRLVLRDGRVIEGDDARAVAELARLLDSDQSRFDRQASSELPAERVSPPPTQETDLMDRRGQMTSLELLDNPAFKRQARERLRIYLDAHKRFRVIDAMQAWLAEPIPYELPTGLQNPIYVKSLRTVKGEIETYRRKHGLEKAQFRIGRVMAFHLHAPGEEPNTFDHDPALGPQPPSVEEVAKFIEGLPGDKSHKLETITVKFAPRPVPSKIVGTGQQNPVYMAWQKCARAARALLGETKGLVFEPVGKGPKLGFRLAAGNDVHGGSSRPKKRPSEGMGSSLEEGTDA